MREKEIVEYLKQNRDKGVAFGFMPKEVKNWACHNDSKVVFFKFNAWGNYPSKDDVFTPNEIIALPQNFELEEKSECGWVEFEIDDNGDFSYLSECEKEEGWRTYHPWFAWQRFLEESRVEGRGFTAFGGWQYANASGWFTDPQIKNNGYFSSTSANDDVVEPVIPVKIRFWREAI